MVLDSFKVGHQQFSGQGTAQFGEVSPDLLIRLCRTSKGTRGNLARCGYRRRGPKARPGGAVAPRGWQGLGVLGTVAPSAERGRPVPAGRLFPSRRRLFGGTSCLLRVPSPRQGGPPRADAEQDFPPPRSGISALLAARQD